MKQEVILMVLNGIQEKKQRPISIECLRMGSRELVQNNLREIVDILNSEIHPKELRKGI